MSFRYPKHPARRQRIECGFNRGWIKEDKAANLYERNLPGGLLFTKPAERGAAILIKKNFQEFRRVNVV
jgi:hypothetical protein